MSVLATTPEQCVVLRNVSWPTYVALLEDKAINGGRLAYDQGTLEITSPSYEHEKIKTLIWTNDRGIHGGIGH